MRTALVDVSKIRNRKIAQSRECNSDSRYYINIANAAIKENNSSMIKSKTLQCLKECTDKVNANRYYKNCISIMEKVDDESLLASLSNVFSAEVVPAITDLDMLKESVDNCKLSDNIKSNIYNAIKENKVCDRVINNTKNISKRFNLEKIIKESRNFPLIEPVIECCKLIDTYDMPRYGKLNLTLEQLSYYLQKEAIDYDKKDLIKYVSEYFLLTDRNCGDLSRFNNVIHENMFFEDVDTVDYASNINPVQNAIHAFSICNKKTYEDFTSLMDTITNLPLSVIISNLKDVFEFFRTTILVDMYSDVEIRNGVNYFFDSLFDIEMNRSDIETIWTYVKAEIKVVESISVRSENTKQIATLNVYSNVLKDSMESVGYSLGALYPEEYEQKQEEWEQYVECAEQMTLQEFKIFKFQNLITATLGLDRLLARKGNRFLDFIKKKTKKIFTTPHKFFTESGDIYFGNISADQRFDTCVAVYEACDEKDMPELNSVFSQLCQNLNSVYDLPVGSKVTYTNIANRFEVHYEDCTYICLNDKELDLLENSFSDYDMCNINNIEDIGAFIESCSNVDMNTLKTNLRNIDNPDVVGMVVEMLQYTGLTNLNEVETIVSEYSNRHYNDYAGNSKLNSILYTWQPQGYTYEIQNEAITELSKQLVVQEKVDINSLKLAMQGLKGKVEDLGAKEKELSRNLDINMNHFTNSVQRALTNDRREAIIKGSVIPSFSRCIKTGIALAGIGAFAGPVAAVITAFAGLAVSKNLNHKERMLMIDEIDIELKAVDKEIQMAEDSKNMKKYRQLLTYQKKLQREKQRIKYNIKTSGANDVPDSNMGTAYSRD